MLRLALTACACRSAYRRATSLAQRGGTPSRAPGLAPPARPFTGSLASWVRSSGMACGAGYGNVDVRRASELVQGGAQYVDVRTVEEFAAGHAPGAANVPVWVKQGGAMVPNPDFVQQFAEAFPDKGAALCVGCQSGKRSVAASELLADAGYTGLQNVEGGYSAWASSGLPVEA